jgi:hypothetical protein
MPGNCDVLRAKASLVIDTWQLHQKLFQRWASRPKTDENRYQQPLTRINEGVRFALRCNLLRIRMSASCS